MYSVTMIELNRFSARSYVPSMEVLVHSWLILSIDIADIVNGRGLPGGSQAALTAIN